MIRGKVYGEKIIYIIWGVLFFFLFYSFSWVDILATTEHGMNLWTCLFEGNLSGFYLYNDKHGEVQSAMWQLSNLSSCYDFPIYIIFAIWNFPLWVIRESASVNVFQSLPCLMWMKSILFVFIIGTILALRKIGVILGFTKKAEKLLVVFFLTSAYFVSVIIITGQYDIIAIFFMVCGIYYYLKKEKKKFLLFFAIAVSFKMFAFFLFFALVLYDEKNILKIMYKTILVFLPIVFTRIFIPYGEISNDILIPAVLMSNRVSLSVVSVPIFFLLLGGVYLVCYFKVQEKNTIILAKNVIYIGFLVYAILFAGCSTYPYWIIYMLPYVALMISLQRQEYLRINILLEMGMSVSYVVAQIFKYPACYGNMLVGNMLIPYILGKQNTEYPLRTVEDYIWIFTDVSDLLNVDLLMSIATGIFIVCLICFAVINFPTFNLEKYGLIEPVISEKDLIILRTVAGYMLCLVPIGIYLAAVYL